MSQRKDKAMRKVAKNMADELIPELAANTMSVIQGMKDSWAYDEKVQWCRWFLEIDDVADLMAALNGGDIEVDSDQIELPLGVSHDTGR